MPTVRSICAVNRFEGLEGQWEFDPATLASLNEWGAKVQIASRASQRERKKAKTTKIRSEPTSSDQSETVDEVRAKYPDPVEAHGMRLPAPAQVEPPIVVRSEKDLGKLIGRMEALPPNSKGIAKAYKKVSQVPLQESEILCMVDSSITSVVEHANVSSIHSQFDFVKIL